MHQITDTKIYRNVSPLEDERIDFYRNCAYEDHEALIELGGRPTREVLEKPAWTTVKEKGGNRNVTFHDYGNVALNRNLMIQHWSKESEYFDGELTRWKDFRTHQQIAANHGWLKIEFDPNATDPRLANILVKLNDWREFQNYQQMEVSRYALSVRRHLKRIVGDETVSVEAASPPNLQFLTDRSLDRFFGLQMALESSETLLTWVEGQIPEILVETSATLEDNTLLQQKLEIDLAQQAHAFHQKLLSLEARPNRSVQTPGHSLGFTRRMCHWGLETTRLMKDLWEWRVFLKWRRTKLYKSGTSNLKRQASNRLSSHAQVWVDFVAFRKYELDRTRNWVELWQRMLPEKESAPMTTEEKDLELDYFKSYITDIRSNVKAFQQDVHTAKTRLRLAEQQLAQLTSQQSSSASAQLMRNSLKPSHLPPYAPDLESPTVHLFKALTLDSPWKLPEVHRTVQSIKAPFCGALYSVQSSSVPDLEGGRQMQKSSIRRRQAAIISEDIDPIRVPVDDDICMTDTCEAKDSHETVEEGAGTASDDDIMSDDEDISTAAGEDCGLRGWISVPEAGRQYSCTLGQSGWISVPDVKSYGSRKIAKLPSNHCRLPSSRQTRSTIKQNDILSSWTPMKVRKHSSKKVKPMRARTLESL